MGILDDDATVMKKTEEYVYDEMIHLYLKNQLPPHLANELVNNLIEAFMTDYSVDKRNASYDFCYLYFQRNRHNKVQFGGKNMECSCMHLWSYLASWGMLRNSPLMGLSPAALKPLISYLDSIQGSGVWDADVDTYSKYKKDILETYKTITEKLGGIMGKTPRKTLVTKIMLGIFGCVPAIDGYFYKTFHRIYGGFSVLGEKELTNLEKFYQRHKKVINRISIPVMDFEGNPTTCYYKKAKHIDMFGFMVGQHVKH